MTDKKWIFITLTVPPWAHEQPVHVSLALLKEAWGKMYDKLRYLNGGRLSYVLVYETHKSGIFHTHALCDLGAKYDTYDFKIDFSIPYDDRIAREKEHPFCVWLSEKCTDTGLGWVCHATRIREGATGHDNARLAVGYITKYFTKAVTEVVLPKRARRICTSRDIGSPRSKSKKLYSWALKGAIRGAVGVGEHIWLISEERALKPSDFGDDGYYPPLSEI
jgi:hypothetical protein